MARTVIEIATVNQPTSIHDGILSSIVAAIIVGTFAFCWKWCVKARRWNSSRSEDSLGRSILWVLIPVIHAIFTLGCMTVLMCWVEAEWKLDLKVTSTLAFVSKWLPHGLQQLFAWLGSTAISLPWWSVVFGVFTTVLIYWLRPGGQTETEDRKSEPEKKSDDTELSLVSDVVIAANDEVEEATRPAECDTVNLYGVAWTRRPSDGRWISECRGCGQSLSIAPSSQPGMAFATGGSPMAHLRCSNNRCGFKRRPLNIPIGRVQAELTQAFEAQNVE